MTDRAVGSDERRIGDLTATIRRNALSRIKLGHLVMALAALFALLLNLAVLRSNDSTVEIAVAAADIRAGTTLTMSHLTIAEVAADDVLNSRLVLVDSMGDRVGQLTTRAIAAGEPVLESDLLAVDSPDGLRAMSVPIDQTRAVAGQLTAGDSVDVVLVVDGLATYIATGVRVIAIPDAGTNTLGARSGYAPTFAVTATQALRIAAALDSGEVHIVRSTGSAAPDLQQTTAIGVEQSEGSSG